MRGLGYGFALISALLLLAAWNTGANIAYIIFGGLMSFLLLSFFLCRRSLYKLTAEREPPANVHRDHEALITLRVTNHKSLLPAVGVRVVDGNSAESTGAYLVGIPARSTALAHFRERFPKRGLIALPPLTLTTTFPFGLLESSLTLDDGCEVLVYPQVRPVKTPMVHRQEAMGATPTASRQSDAEFHSLREYVPGDDTRYISWRNSARLGSLVVKELEKEIAHGVSIVLDTRSLPEDPGFEELFEEAVDAAASLSIDLLEQDYQVALFMPSAHVPAGQGRLHAQRILDALARVEPDPPSAGPYLPSTLSTANSSAIMYVSPDPTQWNQGCPLPGGHMIHPREVFRA